MACRGKVLVAVVAVFLGLVAEQQVTFVNGDAQLIQQVCSKTPNPTVCNNCLMIFPTVLKMPLRSLGQKTITCATWKSQRAMSLAEEMTQGPRDTCITKLNDGNVQLGLAAISWRDRSYADAAAKVQASARPARECSDQLKKYGQEDLVNQIESLQTISDVAAAVLRQIH